MLRQCCDRSFRWMYGPYRALRSFQQQFLRSSRRSSGAVAPKFPNRYQLSRKHLPDQEIMRLSVVLPCGMHAKESLTGCKQNDRDLGSPRVLHLVHRCGLSVPRHDGDKQLRCPSLCVPKNAFESGRCSKFVTHLRRHFVFSSVMRKCSS